MSFNIWRCSRKVQINPLRALIHRQNDGRKWALSNQSLASLFGEQLSAKQRVLKYSIECQRGVHFVNLAPPKTDFIPLETNSPNELSETVKEGTNAMSTSFTKRWKPPQLCPGCGAKSQTEDPRELGFYRPPKIQKQVKAKRRLEEEQIFMKRMGAYELVMENIRKHQDWVKESEVVEEANATQHGRSPLHANDVSVDVSCLRPSNLVGSITSQEGITGNLDSSEKDSVGEETLRKLQKSEHQGLVDATNENATIALRENRVEDAQKGENEHRLGEFKAQSLSDEETSHESQPETSKNSRSQLLCQRCRDIVNVNKAQLIVPSRDLQSILQLISTSPYKVNHIYHLVDAADFPLSLIPNLYPVLVRHLPEELARNLSISYIVTRADLLMPQEEQVVSLMTYLKKVLKDALPHDVPLEQNRGKEKVRVISAQKGWSTGNIKAELKTQASLHRSKAKINDMNHQREGAVWIVGKVSVGKSRFMAEICPEGSFTKIEPTITDVSSSLESNLSAKEKIAAFISQVESEERMDDQLQVLQAEVQSREDLERILQIASKRQAFEDQDVTEDRFGLIPPTVSHIPGTTVAPVRVAFRHPSVAGRKGRVRGEIIDLPGLYRGRFLEFVRPEMRKYVSMQSRVKHKQFVLNPGTSLLLGGLIALRPVTADVTFLTYPFTTLSPHVTATEKLASLMSHPDPLRVSQRDSGKLPILWQYPSGKLPSRTEPQNGDDTDKNKTDGAPFTDSPIKEQIENFSVDEQTKDGNAKQQIHDSPIEDQTEGAICEEHMDSVIPEHQIELSTENEAVSSEGIGLAGRKLLPTDGKEKDKTLFVTFPDYIQSACKVTLDHDVTLLRHPDVTEKDLSWLPYRIFSRDILLEGIGWVEVVAQVRTRRFFDDNRYPVVEVLSPLGEGVGSRAPMGADMLAVKGAKRIGKYTARRAKRGGRPRASQKGHKKFAKMQLAKLASQTESSSESSSSSSSSS